MSIVDTFARDDTEGPYGLATTSDGKEVWNYFPGGGSTTPVLGGWHVEGNQATTGHPVDPSLAVGGSTYWVAGFDPGRPGRVSAELTVNTDGDEAYVVARGAYDDAKARKWNSYAIGLRQVAGGVQAVVMRGDLVLATVAAQQGARYAIDYNQGRVTFIVDGRPVWQVSETTSTTTSATLVGMIGRGNVTAKNFQFDETVQVVVPPVFKGDLAGQPRHHRVGFNA